MEKKNILFFGEFEPFVSHGVSISNGRIFNALSRDFNIKKVVDKSGYAIGMYRFFLTILSFANLVFSAFKKVDIFYVVFPTSNLGSIRIILSVLVVKLLNSNVKVVGHLHRGDISDFYARSKRLFCFFMRICDKLLVLSNQTQQNILEWGFEKDKIVVLLNTVDSFSKQDFLDRGTHKLSKLVCISNYLPTKNLLSLVHIVNKEKQFSCDMYGAGESKEFIQELREANVSGYCKLKGFLPGDQKLTALKEASFLVLPSLNEGMPLVILEALAAGTPVICFDIGDISEYLGEDYPGIIKLDTAGTYESALVEKLKWAKSLDTDDYNRLCLKSYQIFWRKLSPEILSKKVSDIFMSVLKTQEALE